MTFKHWITDRGKGITIGMVIGYVLVSIFYASRDIGYYIFMILWDFFCLYLFYIFTTKDLGRFKEFIIKAAVILGFIFCLSTLIYLISLI